LRLHSCDLFFNPKPKIQNRIGGIMNTMQEGDSAHVMSSPRLKIKVLQQMAEALEDEAAGLYHRAAAFEEEEFMLNREVQERQTEISRLSLKLDSLRGERDGLIEKIESLRAEAAAMREEIYNYEEEVALAAIDGARLEDDLLAGSCAGQAGPCQGNQPRSPFYFRRMTLADHAR
jgi:predicted RNase H-like nuclease (RuvC/YqgF family)